MENSANAIGSSNIIIQGVNGSSISVTLDSASELKELIENIGEDLREIPQHFLKLVEGMPSKEEVLKGEAKVYLTTLIATNGHSLFGSHLKLSITITNLHKEHRYFVNSYFVVTPGFILEGANGAKVEHGTFQMIPEQDGIFPKRLEYGEPISISFRIKPEGFYLYEELLAREKNAHIVAFVVTSLGETYQSNEFEISKLVEYYRTISNAKYD